MYNEGRIYIGRSGDEKIFINPSMANRHGMIAGATGTGKTVSLKVMAESFSDCGVPVFLADIKVDLSGMCNPGSKTEDMQERINRFKLDETDFSFKSYPTTYWDVYQKAGIPLRTTISEMGPILLARILSLNDTQSDILKVIFKIADDEGLLLIDTQDLRSMLTYVGENAKEYSLRYGNIASQSLGAIIRSVISLEQEGGDIFFGEEALNIHDWIRTNSEGKGYINILECEQLVNNPTMYSTFMLWMLSELYEGMPEAGDLDKPKMVFFFDEAHMLFSTASNDLLEKIEQVVKLIRSKGVGVYFITQNPRDIPNGVLAQLGNKIQHALHAYTPAEQKGAKAAAESFRANPEFDTYETLLNLGIGEALVSVLDEDGIPTIVKKVNILPPQSQMGPCDPGTRQALIEASDLNKKYESSIDRDSAYERLNLLKEESEKAAKEAKEAAEKEKEELARKKQEEKDRIAQEKADQREAEKAEREKQRAEEKAAKEAEREANKKKNAIKNASKSVASSAAGTVGREVGNALGKTVGGSFGKKLGGNLGASLFRGIIGTLFKLK
ncbi:MAG: DUF853 domain-containing protein [Lachnospiraceae bacterium]|nr:DUF853 domain-containing protein [Lachnospiraceae bacterium]